MKNSDYWKQRFIQLENARFNFTKKKIAEIESVFQEAYIQIEKEILAWYQRLAVNNNVTMAEARKLLKKNELKEFHWTVWQYIKYGKENELNKQWIKELENASAKFHISRLEQLRINIRQQIESAYASYENITSDTLENSYEDSYLKSTYEIQKGFNLGFDVAMPDKNLVSKVLSKPWAPDGYNFSERIWTDKNKLINTVYKEISIDLITGRDPQKAIDNIAKIMNTSKSNAGRLVMTEEAYFSSLARYDCFKKLDVEKYKIVATLDEKTSEICQSMDLKVFDMKDYQSGVTAPPFHVRCRSTTSPYFENDYGIKGSRAADDPETGKTYYVPSDMNYAEWKKTFVDGGDKSHLKEITRYGMKEWKRVDNSWESGIIKEKEMLPRKMKNGSNAVDWTVIQSDEYSRKFNKLSSDERVSSAIETRAKWALSNRDGKATEELYAVSLNDGREITRITDQHYESAVRRTTKFTQKLNEADKAGEKILLLHNHPRGLPPSLSDINALLKNENVSGITVGHNGSVYRYTRPNKEISISDWSVALRHFKDYSEITSMEKALEEMSLKFGFEFEII